MSDTLKEFYHLEYDTLRVVHYTYLAKCAGTFDTHYIFATEHGARTKTIRPVDYDALRRGGTAAFWMFATETEACKEARTIHLRGLARAEARIREIAGDAPATIEFEDGHISVTGRGVGTSTCLKSSILDSENAALDNDPEYDAGVNAIEALILAYACEDIHTADTPEFRRAVQTAFEVISRFGYA